MLPVGAVFTDTPASMPSIPRAYVHERQACRECLMRGFSQCLLRHLEYGDSIGQKHGFRAPYLDALEMIFLAKRCECYMRGE